MNRLRFKPGGFGQLRMICDAVHGASDMNEAMWNMELLSLKNVARVMTDRAMRFVISVPLRYRVCSERIWHEGVTQNIGRTGILFLGEQLLNPGTQIELSFTLPSEMAVAGVKVSCHGVVVRSSEYPMIAANISHSRLLRP
jgi:hypothetical protein